MNTTTCHKIPVSVFRLFEGLSDHRPIFLADARVSKLAKDLAIFSMRRFSVVAWQTDYFNHYAKSSWQNQATFGRSPVLRAGCSSDGGRQRAAQHILTGMGHL
jgi:hypothetical protein